jgi:hypothetical protein
MERSMPINVFVDQKRCLAHYEVWGPVEVRELLKSIFEALQDNPQLADYDALCDITEYTGDVSTDDVASIALLANDLRSGANTLARTALITHDRGFAIWAKVMGYQFARRRFGVFSSYAAAEAWLLAAPQDREAA